MSFEPQSASNSPVCQNVIDECATTWDSHRSTAQRQACFFPHIFAKLNHPDILTSSNSLLLINSRNEVLLVHRPTHSSTFANAHVFPGGAISSSDNESASPLKLCAIRETFEETGLLLTTPPPTKAALAGAQAARSEIHADRLSFTEYLSSHGLEPAVDQLIPFTKWITPKSVARRFETHMFLYFIPEETSGVGGTARQQLPTGDGGIEILSTRFMAPHMALDAAKREEIVLFPPQFYLISALLPFLEQPTGLEDHVTKLKRKQLVRFAEKEFGQMTVEPHILKKLSDGRVVMGLGPNGDKENVVIVQFAKKGEPRGLELLKKHDIAKL